MPTLLRGGTVIDGTGRPPRSNAAILIDGEHIANGVSDHEVIFNAEVGRGCGGKNRTAHGRDGICKDIALGIHEEFCRAVDRGANEIGV